MESTQPNACSSALHLTFPLISGLPATIALPVKALQSLATARSLHTQRRSAASSASRRLCGCVAGARAPAGGRAALSGALPVSAMASVDKLFAALRDAAAAVAAAPDAGAVRDAALRGSLAVLELKARNRDVYEGVDLRRQATADAKQALEKTNLQLQNLQYEKSHYAKEIRTCRDFRSAFLDSDVGLVPEEEFLRRAPPELKLAADGAADAGHTRMLNRLAFELAGAHASRSLQGCKAARACRARTDWRACAARGARRAEGLVQAPAGAEDSQEGAAGDQHQPPEAHLGAGHRAQGALRAAHGLCAPAVHSTDSRTARPQAIKAATGPLAKLVAMPDRTAVHLLPAPLRAVFTALDSAPASSGDERRCVVSVLGSSDAGAERCVARTLFRARLRRHRWLSLTAKPRAGPRMLSLGRT
jgi:hypothetical protein